VRAGGPPAAAEAAGVGVVVAVGATASSLSTEGIYISLSKYWINSMKKCYSLFCNLYKYHVVVLLSLSFRLLRLCVTITNLCDDEGRKLKAKCVIRWNRTTG
jgi:hypothetical protein